MAPARLRCDAARLRFRATAIDLDAAALNRRMVLENDVVFGTVNASRRHYEVAVEALAASDPGWLRQLITRRVPLQRWRDALVPAPDDVKTVIEIDPDPDRWPHGSAALNSEETRT